MVPGVIPADPSGIDPPLSGEFGDWARRLTVDIVPPADASSRDILMFGLSFDGYAYWAAEDPSSRGTETCGRIANEAAKVWGESATVPDDLVVLRTCLFFEQRRWRHFASEPGPETVRYLRALVEAIRPFAVPS